MLKGIDIGNHTGKDEIGNIISSRFTVKEKLLDINENTLEYNGQIYYLNDGKYEVNLDKSAKKINIPLLLALLAKNKDSHYKIVTGLPIAQFKQCKDDYKNGILSNKVYQFKLGQDIRRIVIEDALIFPEGAGAYFSLNNRPRNAIVIDVGGGTTNIVSFENGKISDFSTLGEGTHDIYTRIKDYLNSKYALNLKLEGIEGVLKEGLIVDNTKVEMYFIRQIIEEYVDNLMNELRGKYPYRTSSILLSGGGALLVKGGLSKVIKVEPVPNNLFANAIGFYKVGRQTWKDEE